MTVNKPSPRKRASRHIRPDNPQRMRLTDRDKRVVKAVNDFRVMRQDQAQRLEFPSPNTAQDRLRKLWEHKFLRREFLPVVGGIQTSPILYLVDKRGAELLQVEFGYDQKDLRLSRTKKLSQQFIDHTLGLSEIRLSVALACKGHTLELKTWLDEKAMKSDYDRVQVGTKLEAVLPDAYFVISIPTGEVHFFLEFDRGGENLKFIRKKMAAYIAYFRTGKSKARYGTDKIRVLTVVESRQKGIGRKRLKSLRRLTQDLGGRGRFLFTNLIDVTNEDFMSAAIWSQANGDSLVRLYKK